MFLRMFGIGVTDAIAGKETKGIVTEVKRCWWLKVNTKSVRKGAFDGALFPHIIHFTYSVNGISYKGKLFVSLNVRCPQKGETLEVYYDPDKPENYAFYHFGPAVKPIGW